LILGLAIAPILAWYHGVRALKRVSGSELIIITLLLVIGGSLLWLIPRPATQRAEPQPAATVTAATISAIPAIPQKSIAVLPFVDMSEKKDQEYFSDGLSEELIDHLAHSPDLLVIARTSSFQFKGKDDDIRTIGRKLGVANLLEGSVRTSGHAIRVTAQLINVVDGTHRWSETYDRRRDDIFKIQDDIATAVVTALQAKLASLPLVADGSRSTNVDAYDQFLIGRHLMARTGIDNYQEAAKAFQSAIALDPSFAAAHIGRADAQYLIWATNGSLTKARYWSIEAQLNHAIELAPTLPDGCSARGVDRLEYLGDLRGAQSDLARALELDSKSSVNQRRYGFLSRCLGDIPAAVAYGKEATVSDPLEVFGWTHLSEAYRAGGQAQFSMGRDQESRQALAKYLDQVSGRSSYWSGIADIYAWRGERQQALDWLEKIAKLPAKGGLACVKGDPIYTSLRNEPRFMTLLHVIDAPE
jgi:TolB-like protein